MSESKTPVCDKSKVDACWIMASHSGGEFVPLKDALKLELELNVAKERITKLLNRDGNWIDEWGACRVCDGEIPHGHTNNCDIWKLKQQLTTAQQEIAELRKDKERLDWLENNGVEIGISALAYHEISATRPAIDKGMREIQTKDSAIKGTK